MYVCFINENLYTVESVYSHILSRHSRGLLSGNPGFPVQTGTQFINMVPRFCGDKSGYPIKDFGYDKKNLNTNTNQDQKRS